MQTLWARILAGQANAPGQFSKYTINALSNIDRSDAEMFSTLCSFVWLFDGDPDAVIFNHDDEFNKERGVTFAGLAQLETLGLARIDYHGGYFVDFEGFTRTLSHRGKVYDVVFPESGIHQIPIGQVMLTQAGRELFRVCTPDDLVGLVDNTIAQWAKRNLSVSASVAE